MISAYSAAAFAPRITGDTSRERHYEEDARARRRRPCRGRARRAGLPGTDRSDIKVVSSFGPGGGSDIIARIIAQRLQEKLGQPW